MRKYFLVLAVLGCLLMLGCGVAGRDFSLENVDQLVINQTTIDEAIALFGQPYSRATLTDSDGMKGEKIVWAYAVAVAFRGVTTSKSLEAKFNEDGILKSYETSNKH